jgi:hypothetical protein
VLCIPGSHHFDLFKKAAASLQMNLFPAVPGADQAKAKRSGNQKGPETAARKNYFIQTSPFGV